MKRVLTTTSTVVLLAVLALELGGAGAAVGKTWSITPVGGSSVVADAIASAADGDTVILRSGIYRESGIVVDKRLTLVGEGTPVIDGGEMGQIIAVTADGVRITGLEIANVGVSYMEDRAGIKLIEVKDCVIEGNRLTNTFFGIYLENSGSCTIRTGTICRYVATRCPDTAAGCSSNDGAATPQDIVLEIIPNTVVHEGGGHGGSKLTRRESKKNGPHGSSDFIMGPFIDVSCGKKGAPPCDFSIATEFSGTDLGDATLGGTQ